MKQFRHIAPQSVQAIGVQDGARIEADARAAGEQVVAIDLGGARTKQEVLDAIARGFGFADWFGANLDALYDSLTDLAAQDAHGYVVLLRQLPIVRGFDAETRDALLDAFRDAAEFHAETRLPFRVFYTLA